MNWLYVEIDEVYELHTRIIRRAGTKAGVRDFSLLHSAVERPKATFDGKDLYPSAFAKAAALLQSLCMNHPFTDGNKRTAWATTHLFLWRNGYHLIAAKPQAVTFMEAVDNENLTLIEISRWLRRHSQSYS